MQVPKGYLETNLTCGTRLNLSLAGRDPGLSSRDPPVPCSYSESWGLAVDNSPEVWAEGKGSPPFVYQ